MSANICPSCFATKRCDCGMEYMPSDVLRRGLHKQVRGGVLYLAIGAAMLVAGLLGLVFATTIVFTVFILGVIAMVRGAQMLTDGRTRLRELAHYVPELPRATLKS